MRETREIEMIPLYYDYGLSVDYPVNIWVGGRNSGKSFAMEQVAAINLHNCKNYKFLTVEDVETNIGEGVKDGIEERIEEMGYQSLYKYIKTPAEIKHQNGNNAIFKGYHSAKQQKQVKSINKVTAVWYEEAENITYEQFKALRMQLRGGEPKDRKLFLTMNPINPDSFINQYFFQQDPDKVFEWFPDGRPKVFVKNITVDLNLSDLEDGYLDECEDYKIVGDVVYINIPCIVVVSTHWDNPYLTAEQRADIEDLKNTDIEMWEMLANGKFIRPSNTFFGEFKREIHVIEPFKIPEHWDRYTVTDYGLDMEATLWIAVDEYGKAYAYKESHKPDLIISEAAKEIRRVNGGDKIRIKYAPPDLWNRRQETGKSAWDIFAENGVVFVKAGNNREDGCMAVKEWLKPYEVRDTHTGQMVMTSDFKFFSNCENAIRCIPQVLRDDKNPNVYATDPHDITHIIDAFRYFAIMRTAPSAKKSKKLQQEHLPEALKSRPQPKNTGLAGDPQGGLTW